MSIKYDVHYTEHKNSSFATGLNFFLNWIATLLLIPAFAALPAALYEVYICIKQGGNNWAETLAFVGVGVVVFFAAIALRKGVLIVTTKLTRKVAAIDEAERIRAETPLEPEGRPCAMCGKMINKQADVCSHCGYAKPKTH